ncbi:hypothetical protein BD626DRAFT_197166 [Schizophyllum amplum]|uniref:Lysine-specific metallo-endopeptidase domain-containing protein n=1 Tax=Schizophyllum amplum TaxID=97359 RepID=A0A550CMX2_9AGAR|nr:hypothetical protein BD626DRAFT_197166 [Auriculariopsis ampla]
MFSATAKAALVSVALSAMTASATQSVSLKVAGPSDVTDVENLKVTTTITNTGDETLRLFNDPNSALSTLPANTFAISNSAGAAPKFQGIKAKYSRDTVVAKNLKSFTVLAPGESIDTTHDLSAAYNFTESGEDAYTFDAAKTFYHLSDNGSVVPVEATTKTHSAKVAGKLAVSRKGLNKRAKYNGCSSDQESQIDDAVSAATTYASDAFNYLSENTESTDRYSTWFGEYDAGRHDTVLSHYQKISEGDYTSFTYDCTCTDDGTYAYVYPDSYGEIYLCPVFWDVDVTGTDSKGGTLVHEASHFTDNGGTDDIVYGQSSAKSLASSDPDQAIQNADNHEYFAENNPSQS